jgi:hypothetical protein
VAPLRDPAATADVLASPADPSGLNLINVLQTAASNLTLAEEAAKGTAEDGWLVLSRIFGTSAQLDYGSDATGRDDFKNRC